MYHECKHRRHQKSWLAFFSAATHTYLAILTLARLWQSGQQSRRNGESSHPSPSCHLPPLTLMPPPTPHPHTTSHPSPSHHLSPLTLTPLLTPHPHPTHPHTTSHPSPSHHSPINPTHLQACNRTDILGCLCVLKTVSFLEGRVHCQAQLHHVLKQHNNRSWLGNTLKGSWHI